MVKTIKPCISILRKGTINRLILKAGVSQDPWPLIGPPSHPIVYNRFRLLLKTPFLCCVKAGINY